MFILMPIAAIGLAVFGTASLIISIFESRKEGAIGDASLWCHMCTAVFMSGITVAVILSGSTILSLLAILSTVAMVNYTTNRYINTYGEGYDEQKPLAESLLPEAMNRIKDAHYRTIEDSPPMTS